MNTPDFSNMITDPQLERLAILSEEASEVIKAVNKIIRHGYLSLNPDMPSDGTNRFMLEKEIGHLLNAVDMLIVNKDLSEGSIYINKEEKRVSSRTFLHFQ